MLLLTKSRVKWSVIREWPLRCEIWRDSNYTNWTVTDMSTNKLLKRTVTDMSTTILYTHNCNCMSNNANDNTYLYSAFLWNISKRWKKLQQTTQTELYEYNIYKSCSTNEKSVKCVYLWFIHRLSFESF